MKSLIQKVFPSLALGIALLVGGADARAQPALMVYDFNLGMEPAANVDYVKGLGFAGLVTSVEHPSDLPKLVQYARHVSTLDDFDLLAFVVYDFAVPAGQNLWREALPILARAGAPLWVIVRNAPSTPALHQLLRQMAHESKLFGVSTVIYPHWGTSIETAADASAFIEAIGHPNLKNSLHTCHEIRGGNQDDLPAVVVEHAGETSLVTIAGADEDAYAGPFAAGISWDDAIKPLDEGDFSLLPFLQALHDSGYDGPVILHTFGIIDNPGHLERSLLKYAEYTAQIVRS